VLLINVVLDRANLSGVDLRGGRIGAFSVRGADLSGVDLRGSTLRSMNLRGVILRDAKLATVNFLESRLDDADLTRANLHEAHLNKVRLHGANLSGADLSYADLSGADLSGADLDGAPLQGACLLDATLPDRGLEGAIGTDTTLCQPGDPEPFTRSRPSVVTTEPKPGHVSSMFACQSPGCSDSAGWVEVIARGVSHPSDAMLSQVFVGGFTDLNMSTPATASRR
jgi:uncharacterized protein YjbI with pentapeptide repeats